MTDLPAERCAELRQMALNPEQTDPSGWWGECLPGGKVRYDELLALLDATEPVADAEVQSLVKYLGLAAAESSEHPFLLKQAAALLERQARQVADLRAGRVGVDRVESQPFTPPHEDE